MGEIDRRILIGCSVNKNNQHNIEKKNQMKNYQMNQYKETKSLDRDPYIIQYHTNPN